MTTGEAYFDYDGERERAIAHEDALLSRETLEMMDSEYFALALSNQSLNQPSADSPTQFARNIDLIYSDPRSLRETITRWYRHHPVDDERKADLIDNEFSKYLLARKVSEAVVDDPRTRWGIEQGLTIIPPEVIEEVQAEYFNSALPSETSYSNAHEGVALGITTAAGVVAQELTGSSVRELLELTSIFGLAISLRQEAANLRTAHYDKPGEYVGEIQTTFTGQWINNFSLLRDTPEYGTESDTELDIEIAAIQKVITKVVYYLMIDIQHARWENDTAEIPMEQITHAQDFLVDFINARWSIRSLSPVIDETAQQTPPEAAGEETASSPSEALESIFQTMSTLNIKIPDDASIGKVLDSLSGKVTIRGNFRPELILRNALVDARKQSKDPKTVRTLMQQLNVVINSFTTK